MDRVVSFVRTQYHPHAELEHHSGHSGCLNSESRRKLFMDMFFLRLVKRR